MLKCDDCSLNLLYPTFANLTSHFFHAASHKRVWLMDYYLTAREMGIKGSTPLKGLFPRLPDEIKLNLAKVLLYTPFPQLGFFGQRGNTIFTSEIERYKEVVCKRDKLCPMSFSQLMQNLYKNSLESLEAEVYCRRTATKTIIKKAEAFIAANDFTAFSVNQNALHLAGSCKTMLDIAHRCIPTSRMTKPDYHSNLFKNAFLTAEISLPVDLLEDLRLAYVHQFKNFIPTTLFYSLCYQTTLGVNFVPNVESVGFVLGYRGPEEARYNYVKQYNPFLGSVISQKFNIRYDRMLDIIHHADTVHHALTLDPDTQKSETVDIRELPNRNNPYRVQTLDTGEKVLGKSRGGYIIDGNTAAYHKVLSPTDHRYTFSYEVRFLTTRSRMTRSLKNSAFTRNHFQIRAFDRIVDLNEITKPDLKLRPKAKDNRWLALFDEYLASDFSVEALAAILSRDESLRKRLQPKLRYLKQALKGKSLYEADLCKISYAGLAFESEHGKSDEHKDLYLDCLALWVQESKNPILPNPVSVVIKKIESGNKHRIVCKQPILISIFESFANRIWQVVFQKINKAIGYSVSNYLPGLAVPLYTMERFAEKIGDQDFALCNMDVKSCFDNINLAHPNFLKALEDGLECVADVAGKEAATFMRFLFKDYLYANLITHNNFKFRKSKKCSGDITLPSPGSLPTGFVLSPALWLTLALPAILETNKRVLEGSLFAFDLCGDDLIAVAPTALPEAVKAKVCEPWFKLADTLSLKFHFFKNYKDGRVYFNNKWDFLFEGKEEPTYQSAWIDKFPAFSIPVFHAGTLLAGKKHVETITSVTVENAKYKLYTALSKRIRDKGANFLPLAMIDALSLDSSLDNSLEALSAAKRLGDQEDEKKEKVQFVTGAQGSVMPYFNKSETVGGRGISISKRQGWILQYQGQGQGEVTGAATPHIRTL